MTIPGNSVEALLFDLGGVVIDIDFGRCVARWARSAGRQPAEIGASFSFDASYEAHERGALDAAGYFASLRRSLSVDLSDDELLAGWNDIYVGVFPEIGPLLERAAARLPIHAFTNSNPSHRAVWSEQFADDLQDFTSVFVSSDLGLRKPDRAAFDAVVERIGVPAPNVVFFDDSPENVEGAIAAGLRAVHVTSTESVGAALAELGI